MVYFKRAEFWHRTGPDFDRREDPSGAALAADERVELIRLKLFDSDSRDRLAIETTAHLGCPLEPARDGVPGNPLDPSNRGNADTLDSESDDRIKRSSSILETVVGRAFRRRERLSALDAPVSTAFPGPRSVETVADDAPGTDFSVQRTLGVETAELLHFAGPCRRKNCVFRNRAQTLPRTPVRRRPPTLDSGSTNRPQISSLDALGIHAESRVFRDGGLASDPWAAGGERQAHRGCARLAQIGCVASYGQ